MASRRSSKSARSKSRSRSRSRRSRGRRPVRTRPAWRDELSDQLSGHTTDMVAVALLVAGLLSLLAIVSHVVGPVGRGIDAAAAALLGRGKLLVPIALLAGAAAMWVPRSGEDERDASDTAAHRGWRFGVGVVLVCGAIVGGFHLGRGTT